MGWPAGRAAQGGSLISPSPVILPQDPSLASSLQEALAPEQGFKGRRLLSIEEEDVEDIEAAHVEYTEEDVGDVRLEEQGYQGRRLLSVKVEDRVEEEVEGEVEEELEDEVEEVDMVEKVNAWTNKGEKATELLDDGYCDKDGENCGDQKDGSHFKQIKEEFSEASEISRDSADNNEYTKESSQSTLNSKLGESRTKKRAKSRSQETQQSDEDSTIATAQIEVSQKKKQKPDGLEDSLEQELLSAYSPSPTPPPSSGLEGCHGLLAKARALDRK